jgi:hypothetical protein
MKTMNQIRLSIRFTVALLAALLLALPLYALDDDDHDSSRDRDRDRKVEKADTEEATYDTGTEALDDHDWRKATRAFREVAGMHLEHADAALYWLAYAQNKMGERSDALDTLLNLQKAFPKSRWLEDAKSLEVEIRQSAGQVIKPEQVGDEDVKLMALNGLMNSDPEQAAPILENILKSHTSSNRIKDRALFVLTQSGSPKALEIVSRTARDGSNPNLQSRAVRYLGIAGGDQTRKLLADIYAGTSDVALKKSVLRSYMIAGDRVHVVVIARSEQNAELREDAVRQLGIMGARNELSDLYASEPSVDVRKKIISAMFIGGNAEKLADIVRSEKVEELRLTAVKNLGLLGGARSRQLLESLYDSDPSVEMKKTVIKSLFIQGNASALVKLARKEKDPELKREIISKLSIMKSTEASDYLMEYLKE